ncbi:hypothetical protein HD806DRAFT_518404 [Xylariaceae sp. AK1471]|nr:hypothetical protein HD806DRAFT_518404 [Xylariaceae sp. AK1471]
MPQCGDDGWPFITNGMCCNNNSTTGIVLAGGTTVICCPSDDDCQVIKPITCDLDLQNPHPVDRDPPEISTIFTDGDLPGCGGSCCPWGYGCGQDSNGNAQCIMDRDQSLQPDGKLSTSLTTTSTEPATSNTASRGNSASTLETVVSITTSNSLLLSTIPATVSPASSPLDTSAEAPLTTQPVATQGAGSTEAGPNLSGNSQGVGFIAGIAVGGFVLVSLISGGLIYLLWRRIRRAEKNSGRTTADGPKTYRHNTNASAGAALSMTPTDETYGEKVAELPAVDQPCELGNTQIVRPPPAGVYELE